MRHITGKAVAIALAVFAAASVTLLWSWNTLAPLFGAPPAEFRHVLAALLAVACLRLIVGRNRYTSCRR